MKKQLIKPGALDLQPAQPWRLQLIQGYFLRTIKLVIVIKPPKRHSKVLAILIFSYSSTHPKAHSKVLVIDTHTQTRIGKFQLQQFSLTLPQQSFTTHEPRRRRGEWCGKIIQEAWDVVIASAITTHVAKSFYQKIKLRLLRYPRHLQQVPRSSFHST